MLNADLRSIAHHRAMATQDSSSPPRPRLVVQIGVTGQRPNRLSPDVAAALPAQCDQILRAIAALAFRAHDPLLHSVAPPRDEFHALLAKALAVFQIDGVREAADVAYERVGRFVLEQSDFLIAI